MIEYTLVCDDCGRIICASKVSPAQARLDGRLYCSTVRLKGKDLCSECAREASERSDG